jgi:hypothetical protein
MNKGFKIFWKADLGLPFLLPFDSCESEERCQRSRGCILFSPAEASVFITFSGGVFFQFLFFYPGSVPYLCNLNDIHMKVTREQAQETIAKEVSAYLEKYGESTGVPLHILASKESREHVVIVGTSIMMNRLGFNTYPGSFVQAVLDDSLSGAFNRADSINQQSLRFYATMMHSLGINISPE